MIGQNPTLTTEEKAVITAINDPIYTVTHIEIHTCFPGDPNDLPPAEQLHIFGASAFLRAVRGMLKIREREDGRILAKHMSVENPNAPGFGDRESDPAKPKPALSAFAGSHLFCVIRSGNSSRSVVVPIGSVSAMSFTDGESDKRLWIDSHGSRVVTMMNPKFYVDGVEIKAFPNFAAEVYCPGKPVRFIEVYGYTPTA